MQSAQSLLSIIPKTLTASIACSKHASMQGERGNVSAIYLSRLRCHFFIVCLFVSLFVFLCHYDITDTTSLQAATHWQP